MTPNERRLTTINAGLRRQSILRGRKVEQQQLYIKLLEQHLYAMEKAFLNAEQLRLL